MGSEIIIYLGDAVTKKQVKCGKYYLHKNIATTYLSKPK